MLVVIVAIAALALVGPAIMMVPALIAFALVPRGRFAARAPSAGLLGSAP